MKIKGSIFKFRVFTKLKKVLNLLILMSLPYASQNQIKMTEITYSHVFSLLILSSQVAPNRVKAALKLLTPPPKGG